MIIIIIIIIIIIMFMQDKPVNVISLGIKEGPIFRVHQ